MYTLNTIELIKRIRGLGIKLSISNGAIRFEMNGNIFPNKLRESLAVNNKEVLQLLGELQAPAKPIPTFSLDKNLPVSFSQQRFWMLEQYNHDNSAPNMFFSRHLSGQLKHDVLEQSLGEVVRRHNILRTVFTSVDGRLEQEVLQTKLENITVRNLPNITPDETDAEIRRLLCQAVGQPFDLQSGPLFRCGLLRKDAHNHILFFVLHPAIADDFSFAPLFDELFTLYNANCRNIRAQLPDLPAQFSDFTIWQLHKSDKIALEDRLEYWQTQLGNAPGRLELPINHGQTDEPDPPPGYPCFHLENVLAARLNELARQQDTTLSNLLLTSLVALLHRYGNINDVYIGLKDSNRRQHGLETLIGPAGNTLVLRISMSGQPDFLELLKKVRQTSNEAQSQSVPIEHLIRTHRETPAPGAELPFRVLFEFRQSLHENDNLEHLVMTPLGHSFSCPESDLALSVEETDDGISCVFRYRPDLTTSAAISRMSGHFLTLLEAVASNPGYRISELPLLTRAERQTMLIDWNSTEADFPHTLCLHQLIETQAEHTPNEIAVAYKNETLTYRELNTRANQLAHYLNGLHVGPEVLVGICVKRSLDMVVGLLGILKAGGAYIPMDPGYPRERLEYMLSDSKAQVLLTQKNLALEIPESGMQVVYLDSDWATIANECDENLDSGVRPDNPAYVIYTSGSSGKPKGVVILHHGVVNYLTWAIREYAVSEGTGAPVNLSFAFDASVTSIFSQLIVGKPIILLPEQEEIEALVRALSTKADFSFVKLTPAHLAFLNVLIPADVASGQTRSLVIGGETLLWQHISFWLEHAPDTRLINEYGPTEATVACCIYTATTADMVAGAVPIGRPIANTSLYILDEHLQPLPVGVTGELFIGGAGVSRGYLNRPELTASKFISNPFSNKTDARLYRSGDLARYRADGNIEFLGRIDDQVKIRGYRVEPGEIETVLSNHPAVQEVVVVARDGASGKQLVAYIVVKPESHPELAKLRRFLRDKLPDHMIPAVFTELEAIPLTTHGKVDRDKLPEPSQVRNPGDSGKQLDSWDEPYFAPRNLLEYRLGEICNAVFHIGVPIGMRDNFFDIGGDSLSALQLTTEIEQVMGKRIPLMAIIQSPTIEKIATIIKNDVDTSPRSSLVPIQAGKEKPPVFLMHFEDGAIFPAHYRFARKFDLDQPVFGLQAKGVDGIQKPYEHFEEVAAEYARDICASFPNGPHHLIGICHGAPVVYEVAQQLYKRGVAPGLVVLIMPVSPRLHMSTGVIEALGRPFANDPEELQQIVDAQHRARINYRPQPFPGKVIYIEGIGPIDESASRVRQSWADLAAGGMAVFKAPCNHDALFHDASLEILARNLCMLFERKSFAATAHPNAQSDSMARNRKTINESIPHNIFKL